MSATLTFTSNAAIEVDADIGAKEVAPRTTETRTRDDGDSRTFVLRDEDGQVCVPAATITDKVVRDVFIRISPGREAAAVDFTVYWTFHDESTAVVWRGKVAVGAVAEFKAIDLRGSSFGNANKVRNVAFIVDNAADAEITYAITLDDN
jgi:hypothetical protein